MSPLLNSNNENYRCKNCQSPHCVLKASEDEVIVYYECENCGQKNVKYINDYKLMLAVHDKKVNQFNQ